MYIIAKRAVSSKQTFKSKSNEVSSDYQDLTDISDDLADDINPNESVKGK